MCPCLSALRTLPSLAALGSERGWFPTGFRKDSEVLLPIRSAHGAPQRREARANKGVLDPCSGEEGREAWYEVLGGIPGHWGQKGGCRSSPYASWQWGAPEGLRLEAGGPTPRAILEVEPSGPSHMGWRERSGEASGGLVRCSQCAGLRRCGTPRMSSVVGGWASLTAAGHWAPAPGDAVGRNAGHGACGSGPLSRGLCVSRWPLCSPGSDPFPPRFPGSDLRGAGVPEGQAGGRWPRGGQLAGIVSWVPLRPAQARVTCDGLSAVARPSHSRGSAFHGALFMGGSPCALACTALGQQLGFSPAVEGRFGFVQQLGLWLHWGTGVNAPDSSVRPSYSHILLLAFFFIFLILIF